MGFRFSVNKSPCEKCGKWVKGCRDNCEMYAEFEKSKQEVYETKRKSIQRINEFRGYQKHKRKHSEATSATKARRERYYNGEI